MMALRTDTLYVIDEPYRDEDGTEHEQTFGRTPDGLGMYWYGDEDEARGDVEQVARAAHFETYADFDEWREGQ